MRFEAFRRDMSFAARTLWRSPAVVLASTITIALGVGANAAMFSLADRLFLRPPPGVTDAGSLKRLYVRTNWSIGSVTTIQNLFTYPAFAVLDTGLSSRMHLVAYSRPDTMPMRLAGATSTIHGSYVTHDYFSTLGVRPAFGRFFAPDEDVMGAPVYVAVISDGLWRRAFNSDSAVLGRVVEINRQRVTVVGITPRGFTGTDLNAADAWMPLPSIPARSDGTWYKSFRAGAFLELLGRVSPGTSDEWLRNVGTTVVRRSTMGRTNVVRDTGAVVLPGSVLQALGPSITPAPEVAISTRLIGVTIIVLLIACANVASLLLTRAIGRRREIAVRLALGASRRRLIGQLLIEGILLSVVAGIAALVVGETVGGILRATILPDTYWAQPVLDVRVVVFTLMAAVATGILSALTPAIQATRPELTSALKSGARDGSGGAHRTRLRRALLVTQVALSVMLLYGAGLFVRSLSRIRAVDVGFDADRLVYATEYFVNPDGNFVDYSHSEALPPALERLSVRLAADPDVEATALASDPPMAGFSMVTLYFHDGREVPRLDKRDPVWIAASTSYFSTVGMRLARGRFFTDADRGTPVMVVNETAARTYWPNEDAIGKCIVLFRVGSPCATVVGVVRDAHLKDVIERPAVEVFSPLSYTAAGALRDGDFLIVRTRPDRAARIAELLRKELASTFRVRATPWVRAMSASLDTQFRPWRIGLSLFAAFGVLALVVAGVGTYSVISYSVSQRAHELSVRTALGARASDLVRLVVDQGLRVSTIGVGIGLAAALAAGGIVQSLLYGTRSRDPLVAIGVALLLVLVVLIACAIPARRAGKADPVVALRSE